MGMFEPPREVLRATGKVISIKNEKQMAHCCGGSLGNLKISKVQDISETVVQALQSKVQPKVVTKKVKSNVLEAELI
ncbi:MAG: hypothetical protein ACK5HT_14915 [Draconibacterium sp.]